MEYNIVDSHCHPQFPQYDADRDEVIRRALDRGIGMICIGTDLATSRQAIELSNVYDGMHASVGLHPNDPEEDISLSEQLLDSPKVVAVGEVGLDYYRSENKEEQKKRFLSFLEIAKEKPLVIHCRDAHDDMIALLREHPARGVMHSFNGTEEQARAYLNLGYYIGLNAIAIFSKSYEPMIRMIPLERLLLETDAPYLAPAPYRGKRNEPSYIEHVGNAIAPLLSVSPVLLFERTTENAKRLFGI